MSSLPSFPVPADFTRVVFASTTPLDVVASLLNHGLIDGSSLNARLDPVQPLSPSYFANWLETSAPMVPSWGLADDSDIPCFPISSEDPWPPLPLEQYINTKSDGVAAALMAGGADPFLVYENLGRQSRLPIDRMVELGLAGAVSAALRRSDADVESLKGREANPGREAVEGRASYVQVAIAKDAHLMLKCLLDAGFSATAPEQISANTPLHNAWRSRFSMTKMLLAAGADWSSTNIRGKAPLETWMAHLPQDKKLSVLTQVASLPNPPSPSLWQKALMVALRKGDLEVVTRFWNRAHPRPLVKDPGYWRQVALHAIWDGAASVPSAKALLKRQVACPLPEAALLWWACQVHNAQPLKALAGALAEELPAAARLAWLFPAEGLEADPSVWSSTIQRDKLWRDMLNSVWRLRPEVPRASGWSGDHKQYWRQPDAGGNTPLSLALESLSRVPGPASIANDTTWDSLAQVVRAQPCLVDDQGNTQPDHRLASALLSLLIHQTEAGTKNPVSTAQPWAYWCDPALGAWAGVDAYSLSHQIVMALAPLVSSGARPSLEENQWSALEERCAKDPFMARFWPGLRELRLDEVLQPGALTTSKSPRF